MCKYFTERLPYFVQEACHKKTTISLCSLPVTKVLTPESYLNKFAERVSRYNFQLFLVLWGWSWFCEAGASGSTTKDLRGCPPPHFPVDLDDVYVQGYGFPLSQNQHQ